jgi:3-oxoacyl-[acyl-carrier-protein] synthase II
MAGSFDTRVVVTGIGVVSPIGIGKDAFWNHLIEGRSGIDFLKSYPSDNLRSKLAAEITDFDPLAYVYQKKFLKVMSRDIQLGVSAASMAVRDSKINPGDVDPLRMGVEFGAGHISFTPEELAEAAADFVDPSNRDGYPRWGDDQMGKIAPLWLLRQLPNMPACHVAIEHDCQGPNNTITNGEPSALLALNEAIRVINRDQADVMVVGASSSSIHPVDIARLNLYERLSQRHDDPSRACRPFDRDRDGAIVGEGAAVFVIERYSHAIARGADVYAEILGVGGGCDGRGHQNGAGGTGIVRAVQSVLKRADLRPSEIGHINAHGKSTQRDDLVESRAYHKALGDDAAKIPVTALKSYFGSFDAGSGAVELAGSLLALRHRTLPMTLNYETPDPECLLNVVREPVRLGNDVALAVNRSHMGQSAAVAFRAV